MKKQNSKWTVLKYLAYFTQFGLTMVTPPVLFTWLAWLAAERFGIGGWLVIVGLLLGIATAGLNLWKFMQFTEKKAKESERENKP